MTETTNVTLRSRGKARTRQKVIDAARLAFRSADYHAVTIRDLARSYGMSIGAIYSNFADKAELFEAGLGFKPPVDGPVTRAAPLLLAALRASIEGLARNSDAWIAAKNAIALAESPLDGEVWERHLKAVRAGEPYDPAGKPAASQSPNDAAGA